MNKKEEKCDKKDCPSCDCKTIKNLYIVNPKVLEQSFLEDLKAIENNKKYG